MPDRIARTFYRVLMSRVITLPRHGVLLAATDLHGNLDDFRAVTNRFRAMQGSGMDPQLVICGDLVHGPVIPVGVWPEHLGTYYEDRTPELLERQSNCSGRSRGRSTTCSATMSTRIWAGHGSTSSIEMRPLISRAGTGQAVSSRCGAGLRVGPG
jgi:hypothetical protein